MPSADVLKKRAFCKYHESYSHATNDCNVFRRQVQSALNEGRLSLTDMQLDKNPFPVHVIEAKKPDAETPEVETLEVKAPAILIRPEQAATTQGKNVIIGEPRPVPNVLKNSGRQVLAGQTEEGKTKLTIVASSAQALRHQAWLDGRAAQTRPARPIEAIGQDDLTQAPSKAVEPTPVVRSASPEGSSSLTSGIQVTKTFIPQKPKVGVWKTNEPKVKKHIKPLCEFDRLLAKYKKEKADSKNQPTKKRESTPPKRDEGRNKRVAMTPSESSSLQVTHPRMTHWGPPIAPMSPPPQWGPKGVFAPYLSGLMN